MSSKWWIVVLVFVWVFITNSGRASANLALPALGEFKNSVESQYGLAYITQEGDRRFWAGSEVKAYGYSISIRDLKAILWIEYDRNDRVKKETFLLDGLVKIRNFEQYFPDLHAAITKKGSETMVIRSYPRDQLAAKIDNEHRPERWIRIIFSDEDRTCINMHSKIKGFEISEIAPDAIKERMKPGKAVGCNFNGGLEEYPADGTWQKTDNYFLSQLYFSERLIPRRGTELIVIHHAAMPVDTTRADIHELHLSNGWAGVGYHALVFADGAVESGRPERMVGAHAAGANRRSVGIVLVGDFSQARPGDVQLESAVRLTLNFMKKYRIPLENVRPHRAVTEGTDCPGQAFPWQEFVQMLADGLK